MASKVKSTMASRLTARRSSSKRLISKSDILTLLPQGKKRTPVQVRVLVERGTIALKSLGRQITSFMKALRPGEARFTSTAFIAKFL